MISHRSAAEAGLLPKWNEPVRFAVGPPDGLTSNSWKVWAKASGVYIACRDNFKETKISLHTRGRWRMGFTEESVTKIAHLLAPGQNRAWEIWDEPPVSLPNTVVAFHLIFQTSEFGVTPGQRKGTKWRNVIHIEAAPVGKLTVVTLFITLGHMNLKHESEPSFALALFEIGEGRYAQVIAHGEPEGTFPEVKQAAVQQALAQAHSAGAVLPNETYGYFLGRKDDGSRYLFGARILANI